MSSPFLIRNASLLDGNSVDVRIVDARIAEVGHLVPDEGEDVMEAAGGLVIPGLHDHHIHLAATAAAWQSVQCGPPQVCDAVALARALDQPGTGWIRGVGYHESVAGMLNRAMLDDMVTHRPLRIQHRGGRMWFLNSAALELLRTSGTAPPPGLDRASGQLSDGDAWLRTTLARPAPMLDELATALARNGVTGVTDMGPNNGPDTHA